MLEVSILIRLRKDIVFPECMYAHVCAVVRVPSLLSAALQGHQPLAIYHRRGAQGQDEHPGGDREGRAASSALRWVKIHQRR